MSKKTLLLKGTLLSGAMFASVGMTQPVFAAETMRPVLMRMKDNKVGFVYGEVESISTSGFVEKRKTDGKLITITISDSTKFVRRFGAKSSLAEMAATDVVEVKGTWVDAEKTQLAATFVRNNSVQARHGTFAGTVSSVSGDTFVLQSKERGLQTVFPSTTTKYTNAKGKTVTLADIQTGHLVRVTGVWDKKLNKISEVKVIRDNSLK